MGQAVDRFLANQPATAEAAPNDDSAFTKGLRSGVTGLGGQLQALGGQVAEGYGADDLAQGLRAKSVASQQQAAKENEGAVHSYKDVHGLRDAWDYGTNLVGSSLPAMAAGVVGAKLMPGRGALPALAGATLATMPSTVGAQFEAQQNDPVQAAKPFLDRTATGVAAGGAEALAMNAVPQLVGGKLLGKAVEGAAAREAMPLGQAVAHNAMEAIGGNAAAGYAAPAIGQAAASHLNPERDTSGDDAERMEGAVGGAVMGAPFGALGVAADVRGSKAKAGVLVKEPGAAPADGAPADTAPPKTFAAKVADLGETLAPEKATAEDHTAPLTPDDTPETVAVKDAAGATAAAQTAYERVQGMMDDPHAAPYKDELASLDTSTTEGQIRAKDIATEVKVAKRMAARVDEANAALDQIKVPEVEGEANSLDHSGVQAKVYGLMDTPEFSYLTDSQKQDQAAMVRKLIATGEGTGDAPLAAMRATVEMFGKDTVAKLTHIYDALGAGDGTKVDAFYGMLGKIADIQKRDGELMAKVRESLPDDQADKVTVPQLKEFIAGMQDVASENLSKTMSANELKVKKAQIDDQLQAIFGDKASAVNEAFAKHALEEQALTVPDHEEAGKIKSAKDGEAGTDEALPSTHEAQYNEDGEKVAQEVKPRYYGKEGDNPFLLNNEAHAEAFPGNKDDTRPENVKLAQALADNENGRAEWQSASDYAKENGMSPERLAELTGGKPENYGLVRAEPKTDNDLALSSADVDAMKLGRRSKTLDKNTGQMVEKRNAPWESDKSGASALHVDSENIFDATRIASWMERKDGKNMAWSDGDNEYGAQYRKARAFAEGIAALSDHLNKRIVVPDETVVVNKTKDAPAQTWGELKQVLKDGGMTSKAREEVAPLRQQRDALFDNRQAAREKIQNDNQHLADTSPEKKALFAANEEKFAKPIADMNDKIARLRDKHGLNSESERLHRELANIDPQRDAALARLKESGEETPQRADKINRDAERERAKIKDKLTDWDVGEGSNKVTDLEDLKGKDGKREIDAMAENITLAAAEHGDKLGDVTTKMRKTAGEYTEPARLRDMVQPVTPEARWVDLNARADKLAANESKPAQTVGKMLRQLIDNRGLMTEAHKAELGKVLGKKTMLAVKPIVESLHEQYSKGRGWSDTGEHSWNKIAAEGGAQHEAILKHITKAKDPKALQTSVSELAADKAPNEHKLKVIDAMNERIGELLHDNPDAQYGMLVKHSAEQIDPTKPTTPVQQKEIVDYIGKVMDGSVDVDAASKALGFAGRFKAGFKDAAGVDHRPAIAVSVHALNPLSVAYHESLHAFAAHLKQNGSPEVFASLAKAADSPHVRSFLRDVFKGQPDALKQVMDSAEERVAYMYQFYQNGMLKLTDRNRGWLDKIADYVKGAMGIWTNDARAQHIMDYFHSGDYIRTSGVDGAGHATAVKYMMEKGRNKTLDYLAKTAQPLNNLMSSAAGIGSARIRDMGIPALTKIADVVRLHGTKEGADMGYLPAAGVEMRARSQRMVEQMGHFTFEEANEAMANIALGKTPGNVKQIKLMDAMRSTLDEMHDYMREAGVNIGDRGRGAGYVPRQWDAGYLASHQAEFRAMIEKYVQNGDFKGDPNALLSRLMRDDGSEIESADAGARPGDQYAKKRDLHFITAEDAQPFMEKNAMRVLTSYIKQGTRRAEWARRFEKPDAQELAKIARDKAYQPVSPLDKMRAEAVKQGATADQMALLEKYLSGVTGQLGSDVKPETRKLFGQMMVYQNLRLLPLGFFSTMIDPVGVAVRGGSLGDVFNNFKRGIMEIPRGFKKNPKNDAGYQFAEDLGVIDSAVLQHVMGASYGLNAVGNRARAINETLFKWNLMEQMNTSQRVGATEAAMGFLKKHGKGDFNEHSMRYLGELGLKPSDIKLVDGRVAAREEDFAKLGMKPDAALAAHLKMRQAINSWVDGAVLRPDQSNKAIWMNDAHFSFIAHMKQFAFAFQDTMLKRVANEMKHGNYQPAMAMAAYIPVMLAADTMKGLIQGGGAQPAWKQDWGMGDYMGYEAQRSGLFGVGQFGLDAFKDMHHGGTGLGALGGPTISQLSELAGAAGGKRSWAAAAVDSMPANALYHDPALRMLGAGGDSAPTVTNDVD